MGPTASGKTDLAVSLLEHLPVELVSVDSALIYRSMNIGTAKPEPELLARAPHRLIDILDPWESYSVAQFYHDAMAAMEEITRAGKIPLLVGGTMMYFRVLRDGIAALPSASPEIRAEINALAAEKGWEYIHSLLKEVDPESAQRINPADPQRLQRALEVYRISGKTLSQFWAEQNQTGKEPVSDYTKLESVLPAVPYSLISLAISPLERSVLHERIAQRFDQMLEQGLVEEVRSFYQSGRLDASMPSMRCVGYRQVWDYLDGQLNYAEMRERGIIATRQLAKRQLTWLRSWPDLHWLETGDKKVLEQALKIIRKATN